MPEVPDARTAGRTLGEISAQYGGQARPRLSTGKKFWREKLAANVARDRRVNRALRRAGWKVVRIWEHELSGKRRAVSGDQADSTEGVLRRIRKALGR